MSELLPHSIYIFLLHCICVTLTRTPSGENDLSLKQFTQDEIMFDMLAFVRSAVATHLLWRVSPQGSLDNISIILLCFPAAPQLSAEALHQEAELEDLLESKVAGV